MAKDHGGSPGGNDPNQFDPWVQSQLSTYHLLWLEKQSNVMNKTELFKLLGRMGGPASERLV